MRNRIIVSAVALALASAAVFAADPEKKISGVVIDQACAARFMKKDDPQAAAERASASTAASASALRGPAPGGELIRGRRTSAHATSAWAAWRPGRAPSVVRGDARTRASRSS